MVRVLMDVPGGSSPVSTRKRKPFRLTAPTVLEHPLQAQIAKLLTIEIAPAGKVSRAGVVWFSVDHANYAGEVPGVRIGRGIIAGIPDLWMFFRANAYCIEIKRQDGELSLPQQSVAVALTLAGVRVGIAQSAEDVLLCIDDWHIPRHRRTTL